MTKPTTNASTADATTTASSATTTTSTSTSTTTTTNSDNTNTTNTFTDMNDDTATATTSTTPSTTPANNDINNTSANSGTSPKKPRRSIKVEGNCLSNMLREGYAKVTDASRLGKRLSSEIWNSFGAIQVPDDFTNPSIQTKTVADGPVTVKICHYFVACGKCYNVFKYDGHAYGTTGLVKHLKNCQGKNNQRFSSHNNNAITHSIKEESDTSIISANNRTTNGPFTSTRRKKDSFKTKGRNVQPAIKHIVRAIEELRDEQHELKLKIQEVLNMVNSSYMGQIQILNDGDKVEETTFPERQ